MEPFKIGDTVYHKAGDMPPMTVLSLEKLEKGYMVTCRWWWFVDTPPQERAFPDGSLTTESPNWNGPSRRAGTVGLRVARV